MAMLIKLGAIAGLSSVILVLLIAQSRIVFSLGRDGLLPSIAHRIHPRFETPYVASIVLGSIAAIAAATVPLRQAAGLLAIGTLLAFMLVAIGVLVLRHREPDRERPFRTPAIYVVAPLTVAMTLYLMVHLGWLPWVRLALWGALGMLIYGSWGVRHSTLAQSRHDRV
jgi:APA family basic amino acid/polyamine antiporter